ncbi:adenosylmethionine--8-amino-7-oxononanoate transaminase [Shimazuella kribbensis]|uniref:adenosylmethionine--8-amino-7-oxononanoate transaminase n=1 Tax=Shimazuella kribbensis TaxID=139808 RepID=UPI0004136F3A|nr:adenosylmethionine--8-amino-7-oxononanoate transaminase [Shimazuella kribbensis]
MFIHQNYPDLLEKDRKYVWHPFTQMKDYESRDLLFIDKAEGVYLYDVDGNCYYDTNSSWWVNIHGHCHPRINQAISRQVKEIDHVMFSGITHRTGILLAEKLVQISPEGLNKVFYSDNGSTAVEVAIKMSFQYWLQNGKQKKQKFVYLENSYHGDTIGAMSLGGIESYHALFHPLRFASFSVPSPQFFMEEDASSEIVKQRINHCLHEVEQHFISCADEIAALIVEPLIQMAGGVHIYPVDYLIGLRNLCTKYHIHFIADEVAVGFGRTGQMFACDHARITPDFMCVSKGITAGVLPLAATLCTDEIYDAFYDDFARRKTFTHGHSFTGNPIATAVALESLQIFEDEQVLYHVQKNAVHLQEQVKSFEDFSHVSNVRQLGFVAAFDVMKDKEKKLAFPSNERIGFQIYETGLQEGLLLRPLGDTIYYVLPLCTTKKQIEDIVHRTKRVLRKLGL